MLVAEPYIGCPYPCPPMPMGFGWAWVGMGDHGCHVIVHGWAWVAMGAILFFIGGHRFCASLHPTPNHSQTSRMHGIR
jgi:hypothetical protein